MKDFSYITNSSPSFIESLYQEFVSNPDGIDPEFRKFFEGFDFAMSHSKTGSSGSNGVSVTMPKDGQSRPAAVQGVDWKREISAYRLILGYRNKGHLLAKTNPIRPRKDRGANLDLSFFGFTEADMDTEFQAGHLVGLGITTLRKLLEHLQACYATNVGIEFKYISNQKKVDFLTNEMEKNFTRALPIEKNDAYFPS